MGVGLINLLIYLIVGVFLAGLMVGRTPEYLGKKVEAREMKLAMLALLIHPIMILGPTGLFAATGWGTKADEQPRRRTASRRSSTSSPRPRRTTAPASRGWATPTASTATIPTPAPTAAHWDIAMRPGDAHQPLHPDHRADRPGGEPGGEEADAVHARHPARRHRAPSASCCSAPSCSSAPCCSCRRPRLGPLAEHLGPMPFGG